MVDLLLASSLALSMAEVVSKFIKTRPSTTTKPEPGEIKNLEALNRSLEQVREVGSNPLTLSRQAVADDSHGATTLKVDRELAAAALGISPEMVFRDARRRIDWVFRFNFALAIVLAIVLVCGIAGAIASALFLANAIWATVFGGVAAADILGLYVWKPLQAINSALVATQRLDGVFLRVSEQRRLCERHDDLKSRIDCQGAVWDVMQKELDALHRT